MVLKLVFFFGIAIWGLRIFLGLNPQLKVIFSKFEPEKEPDPELEKESLTKRARRKALCDTCFWFAIAVLVFSAFIGFAA